MKENASEKKQPHFEGLKVAAFESRRSTEMSNLISKMGGVPDVTPSMREIPIEKNRVAIDFAHRVLTGEINHVLILTGVGFEYLMEAISIEFV